MKRQQAKRIAYKSLAVLAVLLVAIGGFGVTGLGITQRGIAVGMSVDYRDGAYTVGVQFVEAGEANAPGSASMYEVVKGRGATLNQALENVAEISSLYPSYAHCKVLLVGSNLLSARLDGVVKTLLHDHRLGNLQLVAVDGDGFDFLTAYVPILETASAYMEKENRLIGQLGGRTLVSVKDYCQRIDASGTKYLPYARRLKAQTPIGSGDVPTQDPILFDLYNTVASNQEGQMLVYGADVTKGVGLIEAKSGQITAYCEDGRFVTVNIQSIRVSRRYRPNTVAGTYRYTVRVVEQTISEQEPSADQVEQLVAEAIERSLVHAYQTCRSDGVDIFSLCGRLYKRYGKEVALDDVLWQRTILVRCR